MVRSFVLFHIMLLSNEKGKSMASIQLFSIKNFNGTLWTIKAIVQYLDQLDHAHLTQSTVPLTSWMFKTD